MSSINTRIRTLFATLADISNEDPVLLEGELWTEKDADTGFSTGRRKVGDGVTAFTSLPFEPTALSDDLAAHEAAANPHPEYLTETEADALYQPLGDGVSIGLAAGLAIALG